MFCTCTALDKKKKKNDLGDAPSDIEECAVWFCHDASMHEVAAVASRVRSQLRSWIKHSDSSISQDSDFMHQQHGSFFLSRVVDGRFCGRKFCQWSYICEVVLPSTVQSLFSQNMGWKVKLKKRKEALHTPSQESYAVWHHFFAVWIWSSTTTVLVLFPPILTLKRFYHFLLLLFVFCQWCHVGLSSQHGCDRISPEAFHLLRIQQYTIGTSFFFSCVALFFLFMACIAR